MSFIKYNLINPFYHVRVVLLFKKVVHKYFLKESNLSFAQYTEATLLQTHDQRLITFC